jgi:prepilin-type N-terminal cleavage/methylation domain-containing protein
MSEDIKKKKRSKGFTLIEILVAILLVGILTAVAVPTYQKAVEKSHAVESMILLGSISKAQNMKKLETHDYTDKVADLDVSITPFGDEDFDENKFDSKYFDYTLLEPAKAKAKATRKNK